MTFYPYHPSKGQRIQTDLKSVIADRSFLAYLEWDDPKAENEDEVLALTDMPESGTLEVTDDISNPDFPRALRIIGDTADITGDVVITGTNMADKEITETIALNETTAVDGDKAFKTVTKIVLPERNASDDKVSVGFCDKLGLPYRLERDTVISSYLNESREASETVATDDDDVESNTIELNSSLDGNKVGVYLIV